MDMFALIRIGLAAIAVLAGANYLAKTANKAHAAQADYTANYEAADQLRAQLMTGGIVDLSKIMIGGKRADEL